MEGIKYNKPALSVNKQIELLKSRGLIINNEDFAKNILSNISYYRLSAYMKFYQNDDLYKDNTTFEDIIYLYDFDKDLKSLIFENIRIIEIALRTKICLHMCTNYGPHWFYDIGCYKTENDYEKTLKILENEKGLKKDTFIKYYSKKYSEPPLPPFWMLAEVLSMGDLSKILDGINFKDTKAISRTIAPGYYIAPVITNWVHVLATVRNICAHHSRLWNRKLKIKFEEPQKIPDWKNNNVPIDKVYGICFVISLLLEKHPYNSFNQQLNELFKKYSNIDFSQMGFSQNAVTQFI
ncbi:Abi family protein [bacterium]|nr:Abi family protein [bacterium]